MVFQKDLSEQDVCTRYITPSLEQAGWDKMIQIRREFTFTAGRLVVRGKTVKRRQPKRADYVLYYKSNIPIAVLEAKDNSHNPGDGMQQALDYAEVLDVPVAISSNGNGFLIYDKTQQDGQLERETGLNDFRDRRNCGKFINHTKAFRIRNKKISCKRIITMILPSKKYPDIISELLSIGQLKQ